MEITTPWETWAPLRAEPDGSIVPVPTAILRSSTVDVVLIQGEDNWSKGRTFKRCEL